MRETYNQMSTRVSREPGVGAMFVRRRRLSDVVEGWEQADKATIPRKDGAEAVSDLRGRETDLKGWRALSTKERVRMSSKGRLGSPQRDC